MKPGNSGIYLHEVLLKNTTVMFRIIWKSLLLNTAVVQNSILNLLLYNGHRHHHEINHAIIIQ
jgi:hypothetical protein